MEVSSSSSTQVNDQKAPAPPHILVQDLSEKTHETESDTGHHAVHCTVGSCTVMSRDHCQILAL